MSLPVALHEDILRMRNKGVIVDENCEALSELDKVGLRRLFGYLPVVKSKSSEKSVPLEDVLDVYYFDNEMRLFLWKWIAPIEIRARKLFVKAIYGANGNFGYRSESLFKDLNLLSKTLRVIDKDIARAKGNNIQVVDNGLETSGDLPVDAVVEISSFGTLSKLCRNLKPEYLKEIAKDFHLSNYCFTLWIRHLVAVRNLCAHHSRFYGIPMRMSPKLLKKDSQYFSYKQFPTFIVLKRIYENIDDFACVDFLSELNAIIVKYRNVSLKPMGFPENWRTVLR